MTAADRLIDEHETSASDEQNKAVAPFLSEDRVDRTYCMRPVLGAIKSGHAINAGKICPSTLVSMGVQFLLGQDITTGL